MSWTLFYGHQILFGSSLTELVSLSTAWESLVAQRSIKKRAWNIDRAERRLSRVLCESVAVNATSQLLVAPDPEDKFSHSSSFCPSHLQKLDFQILEPAVGGTSNASCSLKVLFGLVPLEMSSREAVIIYL